MSWNHGHSWAAGIVTGILISTHAMLLVLAGVILGFLFTKLGALFFAVKRSLNRRWAIRP
jgi:hypothetical protein